MSWASLNDNDAITMDNLQNAFDTGVFFAKGSTISGTQCITKADAYIYAYIDQTYGPYMAKSAAELVVKSDLIPDGFIPP